MKKIKLIIWAVILLLLNMPITHYINLFGAAPYVMIAFGVCVSLLDNEFNIAVSAGILSGLLWGGMFKDSFFIIFLLCAVSSIAVYSLKNRPRYVNKTLKAALWCALISVLFTVIKSLTQGVPALQTILITSAAAAIFGAITAVILYKLLRVTVYKNEEKKKFII